jgi:hypothetical protein
MGMVGNNGTNDVTYEASIRERSAASPAIDSGNAGLFRNGTSTGSIGYADFSQSIDPYNSGYQGPSTGSGSAGYVVRSGDTLQSIAAGLYGDANLWYRLAEANGLSAGSSLSEGQSLMLPAGVTKSTHNAGTFMPYDASEAMGDTLPTTPKPPKTPKCGAFGQVLQAVVSAAVTALVGMIPGMQAFAPLIGNAVGQGFGMATGIQPGGFNWKSLGMTAIAMVVPNPLPVGGVAGAMAENAFEQGIGVAIGLQDRFSWSGVAAAGVAHLVGGINFGGGPIGQIVATTANVLAQAATRSIIEGNSFGDNIAASLPSALGNLAGRALGQGIGTAFDGVSSRTAASDAAVTVPVETNGNAVAAVAADTAASNGGRAIVNGRFQYSDADLARYAALGALSGISYAAPGPDDVVITGSLGQVRFDAAVQALDRKYGIGNSAQVAASGDDGSANDEIVVNGDRSKVGKPIGKYVNSFNVILDDSGRGSFDVVSPKNGARVGAIVFSSADGPEALTVKQYDLKSGYSEYVVVNSSGKSVLVSEGKEWLSKDGRLQINNRSIDELAEAKNNYVSIESGSLTEYMPSTWEDIQSSFFNSPGIKFGYELRDSAYTDWQDGNYVLGGGKYLGSLGLRTLGAVEWGAFETPVTLLRGNGFTPTARDQQDSAIISFALTGLYGVGRKGLTAAAESRDALLLRHGVTDAGLRQSILGTGFNPSILSEASPTTMTRFDKLFQGSFDAGKAFRGRLGNIPTRASTIERAVELDRLGLTPDFEHLVDIGGRNRFVDVAGLDAGGNRVSLFQLYRETSMGTIPLREVNAANDIFSATQIRPKMIRTGP